MADNVTVSNNSGNVGTDYAAATDEVAVGGNPVAQVQFVKLVDGTLNGTAPIPGSVSGLKVDPSSVTSPVSGTFWQATQPVSGTFWQATQPVSGTFFQATQPISAATLPLPTGAATEASLALLQISTGTAVGTLKHQLAGAQANASAPSWTEATHNPLSQTLAGALRIGGTVTATGPLTDTQLRASAVPVSGTFFQATQPVSGTVTANQGTANTAANAWFAKITDGTNTAAVKAASTAAATTDPASVVAISPNAALPLTAEGTAFTSASRGVATVTFDVTNQAARGIQVFTDLTVLGASSTVTVTIQGKDPVSGKFFTLLAGTAVASVTTQMLTVYPGLTAAAGTVATQVVPRSVRISVAVAVAASTFSVGYSLIP